MTKLLCSSILPCILSCYLLPIALAGDRFLPPDELISPNVTANLDDTETEVQIYLLPPAISKRGREGEPIYTLVLDMDETLMHDQVVDGQEQLFIRPYTGEFLREMAELYEIVVFTAAVQSYADKILDRLDPDNYISYRLYRQHTITDPENPHVHTKDLSRIGRELTRTLIIDNKKRNFILQDDNGLQIKAFYDDPNDEELLNYIPFLRGLVEDRVEDVRSCIREYKESNGLI